MKSLPKKHPKKLIKSTNQFPVVGIGASAGGLEAFKKLLSAIPENSGMAYVLVQHLDPTHESMLPEILQKITNIPVLEIRDDITVEPDHIYVIPSNKMMVSTDGVLLLTPRPGKSTTERNLPIDLFFTSLAEVHQTHAIGVVLSGTATDGTLGLKAIKEHGGITFAQDEASAAYEGMPHSAIQAGVVDFILSPEKIPEKILEVTKITNAPVASEHDEHLEIEDVFRHILALLRVRKGTDFTYYKQTTIRRRILRRMAFNQNEEPADYLLYLRENVQEQDALYQDLLIPVTSFFRDKSSFENLSESVFPLLAENKNTLEPVRVWVAGCSTGEEAYSIAICFREFFGDSVGGTGKRMQIFATDLSVPAIAKARLGIYTKIELAGISHQRLHDCFNKIDGNYQVNRHLRDMCIFAHHNFLRDPPFGKMDLISCRNVLIYMEPYLQKKALTTFHYALNPNGFLLLGKSETISGAPALFTPTLKNEKLFTRKDVPGRYMPTASPRSEQNLLDLNTNPKKENMRTDFQKIADDILLSKYTPAGVVVNEAMDIVQFRGSTSNYLEQAAGKPSHNLLMMAKDGLAFELRNILHKTKKERLPVTKENVPVEINGQLTNITIEAIPLLTSLEPHYLILFHDHQSSSRQLKTVGPKQTAKSNKEGNDLRFRQLEQELAQTREDMRSITEDQEAANEELQIANEELQSGSEELQSLNEELETSKEELQSTNEELTVVNHEMIGLNEQIVEARNYAESIVANIREPLLVLDKNLRIKTANNAFYKTFQVHEQETEGVLIYDLGNKQWNIPELRILLEKILPEKSIFNDFEVKHTFSTIGERVMWLNAREVINKTNTEKLILVSIEDITERKKAEEAVKKSEHQFRQMAELMPQKVWTADAEGNKNYFNQTFLEYAGLTLEELKEWGWKKMVHPEDWDRTLSEWQICIGTGKEYEVENRLLRHDGQYLWHLTRALPINDEDGKIKTWIGSKTEIQEQREQKEELEKAVENRTYELQEANEELKKINKELEAFAYVSSHDLQEPLRKIQTFANRILEKENKNLSENGKNYFRLMEDAASRMQTLIEDLFTFSRLTTAERKFESVDLNLIIEEVKSEFKDSIEEKHAIIESKGLCSANIVAFQFQQLMHNLIGNALKFSKPNLPPHILIKSRIQKGKQLKNEKLIPDATYCHISVTDNGIGFENEYNEKIFEVFQRLNGKEEYAGTGIGLSIVKKIVDNHNGIISATSKLNQGTTFDIYIPSN